MKIQNPTTASYKRLSASELSKLAYCELTIVSADKPTEEQRQRMMAGIVAHSEFEKKAQHFKTTPIVHERYAQKDDQNIERINKKPDKSKAAIISVITVLIILSILVMWYF